MASKKTEDTEMNNKELDQIIKDPENVLSEEDEEYISELYKETSAAIREAVENQHGGSLDFDFWLDLLSIGMVIVEHMSIEGKKKSALVIEVVALVLEHELKMGDVQKAQIIKMFKKHAPKAISVIVFLSKKLNLEVLAEKCCPCF